MRRLAVFAKPPVEGRVKTRLSPALPPVLARDLYAAMLDDVFAAAAAARCDERCVYWAAEATVHDPAPLPPGMIERRQSGEDLGARLGAAFDALLAAPGDVAVIAGSDGPDLRGADLDRAFAALEAADLALAPSADGGYGLIGLRRRVPELFRGIEWSTAGVLEQTLARASAARLEVTLLPALDDIDTPADLARWIGGRVVDRTDRAPRTCAALERMGLLPAGLRAG